jgi:hypothetical protein
LRHFPTAVLTRDHARNFHSLHTGRDRLLPINSAAIILIHCHTHFPAVPAVGRQDLRVIFDLEGTFIQFSSLAR